MRDDVLDDTGHADTFEHHRAARTGTGALRQADQGPPRHARDASDAVQRGQTGTVELGHRRHQTVPVAEHLPRRLHGRVDDHIRTARPGQLPPAGREVRGHDTAYPRGLEHQDDGEPDRTAADDHRGVAGAHVAAADRVPGHRQGLGEGGQPGVEARRDRHGDILTDQDELRVRPRRVRGQPGHVDVVAVPDQRQRDDELPATPPAPAARAVGVDRPGELVAQDHAVRTPHEARITHLGGDLGTGVAVVAHVQVGTADPGPDHPQAHLAGPGNRKRHLGHGQHTLVDDDGSHARTPSRPPGPHLA